jgi:phytol kinase
LVPLAQLIRLASSGVTSANKLVKDNNGSNTDSNTDSSDDLANAVSRTGDKREVFGGPLIYVVVLFLSTLLGFRSSPVGVVAVCQMAAGDGLADIVGRRFGSVKWPFSTSKSYAGSAAFVVGAFAVSTGVLSLLSATGCMSLDVAAYLPQLLAISVVCAAVELVPISDDNITVPVSAAVLAALLLR